LSTSLFQGYEGEARISVAFCPAWDGMREGFIRLGVAWSIRTGRDRARDILAVNV